MVKMNNSPLIVHKFYLCKMAANREIAYFLIGFHAGAGRIALRRHKNI